MNEEAAQKSDGGEKCNGSNQRRKRPKKVGTAGSDAGSGRGSSLPRSPL